jgi:hypothetical protein
MKSPLFDNESGFGGNGAKVDNPFADLLNMPNMPNVPKMPKMSNMEGHSHTHSQPSSNVGPKGLPNSSPKGFPSDILKGFTSELLKAFPDWFPKDFPSELAKAFPGGFPGGLPTGGMPFRGGAMFMGGSGGGCIEGGPFKDMKLHIGPFGIMKENNTRCLRRSFNAVMANSAASKQVFDKILSSKNFGEFRQHIEVPSFGGTGAARTGPDFHSLGHGGVGGEVWPCPK